MVKIPFRTSDLPHRFFPAVAVGLGLTLFAVAFQYGSGLAAKVLATEIPFQRGELDVASARLTNLPQGVYFVSLGRTNGLCDLYIGNHRVTTNRGILPELRGKLLMGAAFRNSAGDVTVEARCQKEAGAMNVGASQTPILATYGVGLFLHMWRTLTELLLGPLAAIALLLVVSFSARSRSRLSRVRFRWVYAAFGFVALAYATSIAELPRLFISAPAAARLHVFTTIAFALAAYMLTGIHGKIRKTVVAGHGVFFAAMAFFALGESDAFVTWTTRLLPLLMVGTAIGLFDLAKAKVESEGALFARYLASAWFFAQLGEAAFGFAGGGQGPRFSSAVVTVFALAIAILYRRQVVRLERVESTVVQILRVVNAPLPPSAKLGEIASLISSATHFERASAYLDAHVLGLKDKPLAMFVRVMERGYRKETSRDRYIEFSEDRGGVMRRALDAQTTVFERGNRDNAWYVNVPVGASACINLSDARPNPDFLAYESYTALQRMLPAFESLGEQLVHKGAQTTVSLETLREKRGLGTFDIELGSIFIDIDNYDDNHVRFKDPYGLFIESIYFPALVKKVRPWAVREWLNRDELHLVSIDGLMQDSGGIAKAVRSVVREVLAFAEGEGARLCATHGYDPVSLHMGASMGKGRLICATEFVRVDGDPVERSTKLERAAPKGGVLVDAALAKQWPSDATLAVTPAGEELAKVVGLEACRVGTSAPPERRAA